MKNNLVKNILALFIGLIFSIGVLEIFLRIYNPFPARLKGDKIILPVNQKYEYSNGNTYTINSIGFRGPEPTDSFPKQIKIFCVGGSTTECTAVTDGIDWPGQLGKRFKTVRQDVFVNNAGLNGHSSYGHQILLDNYLLKYKPDFVVFLVGCNDVGRKELGTYAQFQTESYGFKDFIFKYSELVSTAVNVKRAMKAAKFNLSIYPLLIDTMSVIQFPSEKVDSILKTHAMTAQNYQDRVRNIAITCKKNNIIPVFCTQPMLWGDLKDEATGIDVPNLLVEYQHVMNSVGQWRLMELYNNQVRKVCAEEGAILIDLAREMPKSSLYFYDGVHFTAKGCGVVSDLVFQHLRDTVLSMPRK